LGKKTDATLDEAYVKLGEIALSGVLIERRPEYLIILPQGPREPLRRSQEHKPTAYLGPGTRKKDVWRGEWWPRTDSPVVKYGSLAEVVEWLKPLIKQKMK
jgi:hypothetical protein